jgi:hypothetical protein
MKPCIICKIEKPLEDFSKHSRMKDGHINKCKECCNIYSKQHRKDNPEYYSTYEKMRNLLPERKQAMVDRIRKYRNNHPKRSSANQKLERAVNAGVITKLPCFICGGEEVVGHHSDYDRPLDVTWLCQTHHRQLHAEFARKEDERYATID